MAEAVLDSDSAVRRESNPRQHDRDSNP